MHQPLAGSLKCGSNSSNRNISFYWNSPPRHTLAHPRAGGNIHRLALDFCARHVV